MIRLTALLCVLCPIAALAQTVHEHAMRVKAVGGGVPYFCAAPTATAVADGRWSAPSTWSSNVVPRAGAKVLIPAGHQVAYDVESADTVQCVEVRGRLAFDTERRTKMSVVKLVVMEEGLLEVGSQERPVAPAARAEIVIADRPIDDALDPGQVLLAGRAARGGAVPRVQAGHRRLGLPLNP
jgi:hypothetical protein